MFLAAVSALKNKTVPVGESHRDGFCALAKKLFCKIRFALFALELPYFTTFRLCTPAKTENPDPAACGSHHILRTQRVSLTIMRLPI